MTVCGGTTEVRSESLNTEADIMMEGGEREKKKTGGEE